MPPTTELILLKLQTACTAQTIFLWLFHTLQNLFFKHTYAFPFIANNLFNFTIQLTLEYFFSNNGWMLINIEPLDI